MSEHEKHDANPSPTVRQSTGDLAERCYDLERARRQPTPDSPPPVADEDYDEVDVSMADANEQDPGEDPDFDDDPDLER